MNLLELERIIMNTEFPTEEIFFAFAFTNCRVKVYRTEEEFTRKVLEAAGVEFFEHNDEKCQEIDTRILMDLIGRAFPKLLETAIPDRKILIKQACDKFAIKPS